MVHAWLVVQGRKNGKPFPKLDFVSLPESVEVPANEGVIVGIGIRGDKRTTPVNL